MESGSDAGHLGEQQCLDIVPYVRRGLSSMQSPSEAPVPTILVSGSGPPSLCDADLQVLFAKEDSPTARGNGSVSGTTTPRPLGQMGLCQTACDIPGCEAMVLKHPSK